MRCGVPGMFWVRAVEKLSVDGLYSLLRLESCLRICVEGETPEIPTEATERSFTKPPKRTMWKALGK